MKIRIHPLFVLYAVAMIALGKGASFFSLFFAVALHECGHALKAHSRGYALGELVLLPYGAVLFGNEKFDKISGVTIALAGPMVNLLLCLGVLALWWLCPEAHAFTLPFFRANLSLALFNVLPVFPLDGSRVVLSLAKNKARALRGLKIAGIVLSIALFAAFLASLFYGFNPSFGIMALFLAVGAEGGTEKEMYRFVADAQSKDYRSGVTKREVAVSADVPLRRLFRFVKSDFDTTFAVIDSDNKVLRRFGEGALKELSLKNDLSTPLFVALEMDYVAKEGAQPNSTRQPRPIEQPHLTEQPHSTKQPHLTEQPHSTKQPHLTKQPHSTKQPHLTEQPHSTKQPRSIVSTAKALRCRFSRHSKARKP